MSNTGFPRLRFRNGGFYYIVRREPWQHLGRDRARALRKYRELEGERAEILGLVTAGNYRQLYRRSRMNAERRGIPFLLQPNEFNLVVKRAKGKCEVSGIPFELGAIPGAYRRPFTPSLDRINSAGAYEFANVRLICCALNTALSDWGIAVFEKLCTAYYWKNRRRLARAQMAVREANLLKSEERPVSPETTGQCGDAALPSS